MRLILLPMLAGLMLARGALPVSASVISYTYTGLVAPNSIDTYGLFGTAGSDIGGSAFLGTVTFAQTDGFDSDGATYSSDFGGTSNGEPDNASSVLQINGMSRSVGNDDSAIFSVKGQFTFNFVMSGTPDSSEELTQYETDSNGTPSDFREPHMYSDADTFTAFYEYQPDTDSDAEILKLDPSSLIVDEVSTVPLPTTFPMFGFALLGLGGLARMRRCAAGAAIA